MKDLLLYIAQNLVDNPDKVTVTEVPQNDGILFELRVDQTDMGKVIGRHGRIAHDIRTIVKSVAMRENKFISVEIIDQ